MTPRNPYLRLLAGTALCSVALATPIGESRGIEPLAPQDGTAAAGPGAVDFGQDPELVGRGKCLSAARPVREFGRRRRWR